MCCWHRCCSASGLRAKQTPAPFTRPPPHGARPVTINPAQSFLEDAEGNLWPVLEQRFAYERVTRFSETHEMFREGAYRGAMGALAGAVVGAAVGVVTGN